MARRGIPQGSPSSSRLASAVIEHLLEGVIATGTCEVYIHGDDGAICTSTMSEAMAIKNALADRCKNHLFGPFRLKYCDVAFIPKGVGFMGYYIKTFPRYIPDGYGYGDADIKNDIKPRLIAVPCRDSFNAFFKRLESKLKIYSDEEFVNEAWNDGRKWLQAYKLWECEPHTHQDRTTRYEYPTNGINNFVTQIMQMIYAEDERRGHTKTLSWALDFNARCVLSRAGVQYKSPPPSNDVAKTRLIKQDTPPLRICYHPTLKQSFWLHSLQRTYMAVRNLILGFDKKLSHSLKLN